MLIEVRDLKLIEANGGSRSVRLLTLIRLFNLFLQLPKVYFDLFTADVIRLRAFEAGHHFLLRLDILIHLIKINDFVAIFLCEDL